MRLALVCRVLAAASLVLPAVTAGSTPAAAAAENVAEVVAQPAVSAAGDFEITLTSVAPPIVTPGSKLTVSGAVRNLTDAELPRPLVRLVLGAARLATRPDISEWATGTAPAQGREIGRQQLAAPLAAGASAPFTVTVTGAASLGQPTYGALPISIEAGVDSLRTFAGYQRIKQYEPLRLAWAVPLTLDADPALFGADGRAREDAWSTALGAGSRLDRVLSATEAQAVTWAVDPTLVPSLIPPSEGTSPGGPAEGAGDTEADVRAEVEQRIRAGAADHTPWVLPDADADVAAAADSEGPAGLITSLIERAGPVARGLGGRADIAWPADGQHSRARESALRRLYAGSGLAAQLAAQRSLPRDGASTPTSARRSAGGLAVLAYDDQLSGLLARTRTAADAALSAQQFIAESVALLDERPGTRRSVLVAAPRGFDPDPAAAARFFQSVSSVPWLQATGTTAMLADAGRATPMPNTVASRPTPTPSPTRTGPQSDPLAGRAPVLTAALLQGLEQSLRTVRGVALIRDDGERFARTWVRAGEQLASVRWRTSPGAWRSLNSGIRAAARETTTALKVSQSNINFLAETGRLQITVTNDLDVAVENVKLSMEPDNPRLRINSQPPVLRIGANSRATVVVDVTTLAAGLVPIRTTLTTPDGTVIGEGANVQVRVTPTGDWVYWALGAVAGVILLLGIWRSVRRPSPAQVAVGGRP